MTAPNFTSCSSHALFNKSMTRLCIHFTLNNFNLPCTVQSEINLIFQTKKLLLRNVFSNSVLVSIIVVRRRWYVIYTWYRYWISKLMDATFMCHFRSEATKTFALNWCLIEICINTSVLSSYNFILTKRGGCHV